MRHARPAILAVVFVLVAGSARADQVDDFIRAQMKAQNIPGLSLAIVKDGKVVKAEGYGLADRKRNVAATPETVYRIASVSKQFIAAGIMLLVQDGKISLDDSIAKFLDRAPESWKPITIRHLLSHTSGLIRESPGFNPDRVESDAAVIKAAFDAPLRSAPGDKWEYGNLNYYILAEIIHKAAVMPWTDFLRTRIFDPCEMARTHPTNTKTAVSERAVGYQDNDELRVAPDWPALRPSGAFLSTVLDLGKWDAALYTDRILTASTREQMWAPAALNDGSNGSYGLGWEIGSFRGRRVVRHGGGMIGFRAMLARYVDDGLTIIVLMNLDDVDRDAIVWPRGAVVASGVAVEVSAQLLTSDTVEA